jgi:NAD(P)-dependent dehydrogenase (short-subunit alcohol dehydrogenase family)
MFEELQVAKATGAVAMTVDATEEKNMQKLFGDIIEKHGTPLIGIAMCCALCAFNSALRTYALRAGRIDGIVNCTGSVIFKASHAVTEAEWKDTVRFTTSWHRAVQSVNSCADRSEPYISFPHGQVRRAGHAQEQRDVCLLFLRFSRKSTYITYE